MWDVVKTLQQTSVAPRVFRVCNLIYIICLTRLISVRMNRYCPSSSSNQDRTIHIFNITAKHLTSPYARQPSLHAAKAVSFEKSVSGQQQAERFLFIGKTSVLSLSFPVSPSPVAAAVGGAQPLRMIGVPLSLPLPCVCVSSRQALAWSSR